MSPLLCSPFDLVPAACRHWELHLPMDWAKASPVLQEIQVGLWRPQGYQTPASSFRAEQHEGCAELEQQSFWFRHRNQIIAAALLRHPAPGWLLDIGGGNGFVSQMLREMGVAALLLEPGRAGVQRALDQGLAPVIQGTLEQAQFSDSSVPACGLFDVLEHLENEGEALGELFRVLQPGGRLYLTVPAYPALWSEADEEAGHFRRYTETSLRSALVTAGFEVKQLSPFFAFLPGGILLKRVLPYQLKKRLSWPSSSNTTEQDLHQTEPHPWVEQLLATWRKWECCAHFFEQKLPFGSSLIAVAEKPRS